MAASGAIVDKPLSAVAALNAVALPSAEASYALMVEVLQNDASPLIFGSLVLSAGAIIRGLDAYEATVTTGWTG
ncbi:hypothetical protein SAMN05192589_11717 [Paracidovorax valerianellae]|uniref:Uncharacterized protein n=1 Tax=Paracidovorax valerianellae TaxID=187868 RepID=A0A1G7CTJ5_9BURK|nr:hypothetical protein [Paracidovorax valerianellae]SDE41815.1 hypothetical protein SAMN05192589_11717 [Paracidovorax valerianellae]